MAASGNTLVDEIYDQFLVCKVCLQAYKNPKALTCQHTFCRDCLAKHYESEQERGRGYRFQSRSLSCPVCRKRMDLPVGGISKLSDNFLVSNLSEVVERRRSKKPRSKVTDCDICRPKQTTAAVAGVKARTTSKEAAQEAHFRCVDCDKMLCRRCADLHRRTKVTQEHGIFDVDVQERNIHCRVHTDEAIRFYCEPCEVCICVLCTFEGHKDHDVYTFSEGIERHGHSLDTLLERSRGRCGRLRDQIHLIGSCEAGIRVAEEYIRETAIDWVRQIRQQERQILRELEELANEKAREFIEQKAALQETLEALESTCNLTEIVIRDRSVELLLLKDEINAKLNKLLADGKILPLPDIVTRRVAFVPGTCFLGRLDFLEPYSGVVSPQLLLSTKTKRTHETDHDRSSSCVERSEDEGFRTPAADQSSCFPDEQRKPNLYSDEQPNLRNIPPIEAFTVGSKTGRLEGSRGNSKSGVRSSSTALQSRDFWQRKLRNSVTCSDRSNTTTRLLDSLRDQVLDTEGLVRTRDSTTQSTGTEVKSIGTETVRIIQADKSMLTNSPVYMDKFVMTEQACLRSTQTNTADIVMLDMAVTAQIVGDHKATSTQPLLIVDQWTCTTPGTSDNATMLSRLSDERSCNSTASLSGSSELQTQRMCLQSRCPCNKNVPPLMREEATGEHLYQRVPDVFVQLPPVKHDSCANTTKTAVDAFGCAEMPPPLIREIHTHSSFLEANGAVIPKATTETVDKSTNTSTILPFFPEIGTKSFTLEMTNERFCRNLPTTEEIGTNTTIIEDKDEGHCQRLPKTEATGANRAVFIETNEGHLQQLPAAVEIGTRKSTLEKQREILHKNRPQTLDIQKPEHCTETAEIGREFLADESNWSTSLTLRSHSDGVGTAASISKDASTGLMSTGSLRPVAIGDDAAQRQRRVEVSGGTTTSRTAMMQEDTWTNDPATRKSGVLLVDRASSPVRFAGVDKAVSASRGEIAEPVDKFQAPGKHTKLLETITAGPKLDAICEGSDEESSSEEGEEEASMTRKMVLPSTQRLKRPGVSWDDNRKGGLGQLTHRERFAPSFGSKLQQGRQTTPSTSTFSVEGRRSACSILWKVEMGTNTSSVEYEDKATGTDSATAVDSRMAECITKLKTVSQRLEAKQTTTVATSTSMTNSNSTSRESGEMTTSSTSETTTMSVDRQSSSAQPTAAFAPAAAPSSPEPPSQPPPPQDKRKRDKKTGFHLRVLKQRRTQATAAAARPDSSPSESSDQEQGSPLAPAATTERLPAWIRHAPPTPPLARRKRFDLNDMLRTSSTPAANKTRSPKIGRKPPP